MRGQSRSPPLFLVRSSLALSFRCGRCSENNQKGRERRLKATDETRALRLSLSLSLSLTPVLSLSSSLLLYHHHRRELDFGHTFPADDAKDGHGRREESIDAIEEIHAVFDRESTHHPGTTERRREREKERRIATRDDDDSDDSDDDERTTTTTTTTSEEEKRPTGRVEESGPFEQV